MSDVKPFVPEEASLSPRDREMVRSVLKVEIADAVLAFQKKLPELYRDNRELPHPQFLLHGLESFASLLKKEGPLTASERENLENSFGFVDELYAHGEADEKEALQSLKDLLDAYRV